LSAQNLFDVRARRVNINHQIAAAPPDVISRAAQARATAKRLLPDAANLN